MNGGRQTGTVPKTKHNTRPRRDNTVNHMSNNLDWHDGYQPQRARKESNTSASRHSDAGEDMYEENPWIGLAPSSHRSEDDESGWHHVKSSNLTPERTGPLGNVDAFIAANRASMNRQENGQEDRDTLGSSKEAMTRGRIKMKMERSQRKVILPDQSSTLEESLLYKSAIEELQQQQAALMSLRNKAIQQVKPVQVEELHQAPPMLNLRNKAVQQVKPVQQEDLERVSNIDGRLQNMQEYANIIQALERDEVTSNLETADGQSEQQLRKKLNELIAKKTQVDNILAYIESDHVAEAAASLSSDDGEGVTYTRAHGDGEEISRRDITKQDNREQATAAYLHMKELKLEEVKNKLEQLQNLLARVERMRDSRSSHRMNGEASSFCSDPPPSQSQTKNCPSNSVLEKLHSKKFDLDQMIRKAKANPTATQTQQGYAFNATQMENWSNTSVHGSLQPNVVDYSSEEGEADYDESPVKLCSSVMQHPFSGQNSVPKLRSHTDNMSASSSHHTNKVPLASVAEPRQCAVHSESEPSIQQTPIQENLTAANNSALALQISQLQMQMEQLQMMYQNVMEKQHPFPTPQPWLPPNSHLGYMQYMPPSTQWHQHQLLINSLNQCCQLIWHQQRELAGLRQALTMLQEEGSMYKCPTGSYGNNLNFDPGLLWPQPSPQMLNNQVPPGNRANNYWDNFRSYSRQNLLSGRNKSNEGSLTEPLPPARTTAQQTDNLRPKDNCCPVEGSRGNSGLCRPQQLPQHQQHNGPNRNEPNSARLQRRFNASNNLKPPHPTRDVLSLEQCVYSELETVIVEAERSPDMLLQLLSQLKTMRSHQHEPSNVSVLENGCELMEPVVSSYPRNQPPSMSYDHEPPKIETVLEEVSRMIQDCDMCSGELLQQVVMFVMHALHVPHQHDIISRLEVALLKFQGARIPQVGDELLCTIASVVSPHLPSARPSHIIEEREVMIEHIEEEGAVGGIPLQQTKITTSQSVETELAEADQPQHNPTENSEVFDLDAPLLPNIELDNQELPPREDNIDQSHQES